jgi:hypothetical protein
MKRMSDGEGQEAEPEEGEKQQISKGRREI